MMQQVPNILTTLRIALTFLSIALVFINPEQLFVYLFGIFIFAAVTDFADGYVARKYNAVSDFGKSFDPLADKVLTFVFLIILFSTNLIPATIILLLIARDVVVDGVRGALAVRVVVPAIQAAKWKTTFIFLLITSTLFELAFFSTQELHYITLVLAFFALLFSYVSAAQYARIFYCALQKNRTRE